MDDTTPVEQLIGWEPDNFEGMWRRPDGVYPAAYGNYPQEGRAEVDDLLAWLHGEGWWVDPEYMRVGGNAGWRIFLDRDSFDVEVPEDMDAPPIPLMRDALIAAVREISARSARFAT